MHPTRAPRPARHPAWRRPDPGAPPPALGARRGGALATAGAILLLLPPIGALRSQPPDTTAGQPVVVDARETPPVARKIINAMLSPACPGRPLAACPGPQADSLRQVIALRVAAGDSRERIEADLERAFGAQVRGAPPAAGFGLLAWLVPMLFLVAGGAGATRWLLRARQAAHD